jgi:alanyl-tRNA synthetase
MAAHTSLSGGERVEVFKTGPIEALKRAVHATEFLGYETCEAEVQIKGIVAQDQLCDQLAEVGHEREVLVVLDRTPFYGESGGQVGDTGNLRGTGFLFRVTNTQKDGELVLHHGHLTSGMVTAGDRASAQVDEPRRRGIRRAHSATHMLHHALQSVLGRHAQQQGSKVDDDWLRFDFTNPSPVTRDELAQIQQHVHAKVAEDAPVRWNVVPLAEARQAGAMMLFGEKYPDPVRMVSMGTFSKELCGGTHLDHTGEVGEFEIIGEEAVAAGTRRITALTGVKAREFIEQTEAALATTADRLRVSPRDVPAAAKSLADRVRNLKKSLDSGASPPPPPSPPPAKASTRRDAKHAFADVKVTLQETARALHVAPLDVPARIDALISEAQRLEALRHERAQAGSTLSVEGLLAGAQHVHGCTLVVAETPGATPAVMRQLIDELRKKASPLAALLASRSGDDRVTIVAGVSQELVERGVHAGQWAASTAQVVGGTGGGRPDLAQAGGKHPDQLPQAIEVARDAFASMIAR